MSVLRFILFTHTQIYSPRFTRFSLSLSLFVSLSYKLTSQGKLKQISWSRARAHFFPLSLQIIPLSLKARLRSSGRVGTAYFDCLLLRRRPLVLF